MPPGLVGAVGAVAVEPVVAGWVLLEKNHFNIYFNDIKTHCLWWFRLRAKQELAMLPNVVEAHPSARVQELQHNLATTMAAGVSSILIWYRLRWMKQENWPNSLNTSRDFVVSLFLDTFEYGKCPETLLNKVSVQKQEMWPNSLNTSKDLVVYHVFRHFP